jgi:putative ABC transport system substrate-binding protein
MKRREFITLLGGAAVAWPRAAGAQQGERMRRIALLIPTAADDPETQARITAFSQALQEASWIAGRNLQIEYRWGAGDSDRIRRSVTELVALAPEVIVTLGNTGLVPLQRATRTIPIVFVNVADPVGGGFVASLARPGGNATGFASPEYRLSGKWLELLKQISPAVTWAAFIRDPTLPAGSGQLGALQALGPFLGVEVSPVDARDSGEIERAIADLARAGNGGLIVPPSTQTTVRRNLIFTLAARHRLPAVYGYRFFVVGGGLISYGPDPVEPWRHAARYVDRILKGENPADLPVQAPTKYELVINMKTAKALGLEIPPALIAIADEVIE